MKLPLFCPAKVLLIGWGLTRLFPAYAGAILIRAERRRSCGAVVRPSIGRPGGPELIYNRYYAYILVDMNKS